ncbi:WD repeat-containing protein 88-like [Mytilus edulis]|uniref:Uncharacterized protein n=1 Tax=Mytilus edulis TaxID=6550 RepID=A0A8S3RFX0_MYTED|nr:unnamed protein product [Mytilus edulis]
MDEEELSVEIVQDESEAGRTTATWEHEDLAQLRIKVFRGHLDSVRSCKYIDNDQKILSASDDKTIKIWDVETGEVLHNYTRCHDSIISQANVNDNGRRFVSCGWDKKVAVWDIESGNCVWSGKHAGIVTSCNFSHDGKYVVSGSDLDNTVKIWDSNTGDLIHNVDDIHTSTITKCMFAPGDDKIITTSMDKTAKFYDLKTLKVTITVQGHINIISCCDISHDERKFATGSWDKTVNIWDIATGSYRSKGPGQLCGSHDGSVSSCSFSPDGLQLVTGSYDSTVCVWDVDNRVQKVKLQGHDDWVEDVCFGSDQKTVLSCSKDRTIRIWNVEEADKLPVVLERRKAIGLKIIKCTMCGKPFSLTSLETYKDVSVCVFCRMQNREQTMLEIMNMVDEG